MANWGLSCGNCGDPNEREPGNYVNGLVSINGNPSVPCIYGRNYDGDPMYLCIPNTPDVPPPGSTLTATNPSGVIGDPIVTGKVDPNGDVTLKAKTVEVTTPDGPMTPL